MSSPIVSLVIPTLNRRQLLKETLSSVQQQTFSNWECVIIDDASTDGTVDWLSAREKEDGRIRVFQNKTTEGPSACRNKGVQASQGEYVAFLDSDDLLAPFSLAERVNVLRRQPQLEFVVAPKILFKQIPADMNGFMGSEVDSTREDLDRFLMMDFPWAVTGPLWTRHGLEQNGPWMEGHHTLEDIEFHVRALCRKPAYHKIREPDWFVRVGDRSGGQSQRAMEEDLIRQRHEMLWHIVGLVERAGLATPRRNEILWAMMLREALKCSEAGCRTWALSLMAQVKSSPLRECARLPESLVSFLIWAQPRRIPAAVLRRIMVRLIPPHVRQGINPYVYRKGTAPAECPAMRWARSYSWNPGEY